MDEKETRHPAFVESETSAGSAHLAYGDSMFPDTFQPSELRSGRYPVERVAWPDSRYLEIAVLISMLAAIMVMAWLVLRVVFN